MKIDIVWDVCGVELSYEHLRAFAVLAEPFLNAHHMSTVHARFS